MVERPIQTNFSKITGYGRKAYPTNLYKLPDMVKRPIQTIYKKINGYGQKAYPTNL